MTEQKSIPINSEMRLYWRDRKRAQRQREKEAKQTEQKNQEVN